MKPDKRSSFYNHLRYAFDRTISKGPLALSVWLAVPSMLVIILLSIFIHYSGLYPDMSLPAIFWTMLLQALAPNPVDVNAGPWPFLIAMLFITLLGLFMVSIFIGIITNSIDDKIESLRKGRSMVIEKNHTLILGWDEHIFTILSELITAKQNERHSCIVILGDKDKVEMEDAIRTRIPHTGRTEIVCRSGDALDMIDLEIASVNTTKSIIVLAPDSDEPDTYIIKSLLAILNNPHRRQAPYHIVTEIHDPHNIDVTRLVGKDETIILQISEIIAHIIAQTCRQTGLSMVYIELLNFAGDEIYFTQDPSLTGKTFAESLDLFEDSSVIGLWPKDGKPKLNPPMQSLINPGDRLVVITEDESSARLSGIQVPSIQNLAIRQKSQAAVRPETFLILGWNIRAVVVIRELDKFVPNGSKVNVVAYD